MESNTYYEMKIGILTNQNGFKRGNSDFFPLLKWRKEFQEREGITFSFIDDHLNNRLFNQDVIIIDHRYFRRLIVIQEKYDDKSFVIQLIQNLKRHGIKVVLFDNGDGAGSAHWDLISEVDLFVKKQLMKDLNFYTKNYATKSKMVFVDDYELSEERQAKNLEYGKAFTPCPADQLQKIRLGWNIGMIDYRWFPLSKYYPIGTSRLFNRVYKTPSFNKDLDNKPIDSVFRGEIKRDDENYSYQRNKVVELFRKEKYPGLVTGGAIPKNKYLEEMSRAKTCVSPFGWGEVCYRDFEAVLNGCVLVKPDMGHIRTWPDVYKKNETYVSLKWDMSDLESTLNHVLEDYESYKRLVRNAQEVFSNAYCSPDIFIERFKQLIES